jgi:hypothetical protein
MKMSYKICLCLMISLLLAGTVSAAPIPVIKINTLSANSESSIDQGLNPYGTNWDMYNFDKSNSLVWVDTWKFNASTSTVSGTGWTLPWYLVSSNNGRIVLHPDNNPLVIVFLNSHLFIGYDNNGLYTIGKLHS